MKLGLVAFTCGALLASFASTDNVQVAIDTQQDDAATSYNPRNLGGSLYQTRFEDVTWDNAQWTLTTTRIRPDDFRALAYVANGYIGHSFASNGPFIQAFANSSGWPLFNTRQTFGTVGGFFDRQATTNGTNYPWLEQYGSDSAISGLPNWGPLIIELEDGQYLAANNSLEQFSNVRLTQDLKRGLAQWRYTWTPDNSDGLSFNISYTAFAHKLRVHRAYVRLELRPSKDCAVTVVSVLDGADSLRTDSKGSGWDDDLIYSAVSPQGVSNVTGWVYAGVTATAGVDVANLLHISDKDYISRNLSSAAQGARASLKAGETSAITKFVGIASTDSTADPRAEAKNAVTQAQTDGYESALASHVQEWAEVMPADSVANYSDPSSGKLPKDPALIEKSIVSVVSAFQLLTNVVSENALKLVNNAPINVHGISVCGLTADCYAGQRFWDQDVWMHPYLAAVFPMMARQIPNSRIKQYPQAKANVKTAYQSSQNQTKFSDNSAAYPWTSGRDANCTATGPCFDYEYHLNGDIAKSFVADWVASGDTDHFKQYYLPIMESVSSLFSDMLVKNGSKYALKNMTDPDEYANNVDNGGFTMALIQSTFNWTNYFREVFGQTRISDLDEKSANILLPKIGDLSLEYSTMNGSIAVKQADVVLKIYPLDLPQYPIEQQRADLDYYAGKQSPNGPGMTYAIFSIDASDISPSGCSSYTYDLNSWSPYLREPFFLFSEQLVDDFATNGGTNPAFPFNTGHGGYLQVDLFGYLGLRYDPGFELMINPTLPPQIPNIAYPTFYFHGWPIKAVANKTHTTLQRLGTALDNANSTLASSPITVQAGREDKVTTYLLQPSHGAGNTSGGSGTSDSLVVIPNRPFQYNKTVPGNIMQCQPAYSPDSISPGQFPNGAVDGAISTVWQPATPNATQVLTVDLTDVPFVRLKGLQLDWAAQPPVNATVVLHNQSSYADAPGRVTVSLADVSISAPFDVASAAEVKPYSSNETAYTFNQTIWSANYATLLVTGNQNGSYSGNMGATVAEFALIAAD